MDGLIQLALALATLVPDAGQIRIARQLQEIRERIEPYGQDLKAITIDIEGHTRKRKHP